MHDLEVVIVGGGPAGTATALALANFLPALTERILILDRATFPRPKLCGGGVSRHADVYLEQLGAMVAVPGIPVRRVKFILPDQGLIFPAPEEGWYFRVVDRAEFDHALLQHAIARGIAVHDGEAVVALSEQADGVLVRTTKREYCAGLVVGADGATSAVRRLLGLARADRLARLMEVLTPVDPGITPEFAEEMAVFDFRPVAQGLQGYYWDFPALRGGNAVMNRGIFDSRILPFRPNAAAKELFAASLAARSVELGAFTLQGHPIRWFDPLGPHGSGRVVLVGDAAGTDPLVGEGISLALAYGLFAAEYLAEVMGRAEWSCHDYTARLRAAPLGQMLRQRVAAARGFYRHGATWGYLVQQIMLSALRGQSSNGLPFPDRLEFVPPE